MNNDKTQRPPMVTLRLHSGTLITTSITSLIPVAVRDIELAEQELERMTQNSSMNMNQLHKFYDNPQEIEDIVTEIKDSEESSYDPEENDERDSD